MPARDGGSAGRLARRYHRVSRWLFYFGAPLYGWVTTQPIWLESAAALAAPLPTDDELLVLDLGTGPGNSILGMARRRPRVRYIGVDISFRMLEVAREQLVEHGVPAALVLADGARLPFRDGRFDRVTGHSFLYLTESATDLLREVRRVLRPGGSAHFLEPRAGRVAWMSMLGAHPTALRYLTSMAGWRFASGRMGRYSVARFTREAAAAGLRPVRCEPRLHGMALLCEAERPD